MKYTPIQRLFRMLYPKSREIYHLYFFAIVSGIISLSLPLGIQAIINLIQGGQPSAAWGVMVLAVLIGFLFNGGLQIIQMKITENIERDIFTRSAFEFAVRIPKIQLDALEKRYAPELMNRFFDTSVIMKGVTRVLLDFTNSGVQIIFGLMLLTLYHSFFMLFSLLVVFMAFIIGNYIFNRGLKSSINESKIKYKVAFWLEELARTHLTFKSESLSPIPLYNTDTLVFGYLEARSRHFTILVRQYYLFLLFKILVASGFLILGSILVFNQQMNIGQFVAAEIVVLLVIQSSEKILLSMEAIYDLLTSIEKIGEVTDLDIEDISSGSDTLKLDVKQPLQVEFKNISLRYPDADFQVLSNLSLSIPAGKLVGITGKSGTGKISVIKLLLRFFSPTSGKIIINGMPLENYSVLELRSSISLAYKESEIFDGTIMENITLNKEFSEQRLRDIATCLNLDKLVSDFPEGWYTPVGPHGLKISSSTELLILLARCLMKEASLYVFHDTYQGLTTEEKSELFDRVLGFVKGKTVIIVTKDNQLLAKTDLIFNMD